MKLRLENTDEDKAGGKALDLGAAIAEFYREFPAAAAHTFILNHAQYENGHDAVAAFEPQLQALAQANPDAGMKMARSMAAGMFEGQMPASVQIAGPLFNGKAESAIYGRFVIPAGTGFSARLLRSIFADGDPLALGRFPVLPARFNDTEMWQRYVLDHELGHALTMTRIDKQAMKTTSVVNHSECVADAYAMIRHFQRYGAQSGFPLYIRDLRNMNAVHKGDIDHWTARALNVVAELNKKGRIAGLTPAQSVDLALQIADLTALSADADANMKQELLPIARMVQKARKSQQTLADEGRRVMETVAAVCAAGAATPSPAVLHACKRYMVALKNFLPENLPQDFPLERLQAIAADNKAMAARKLADEPKAKQGLGSIFRDALIDAQSGLRRPPPAAKKQPPKAPPRP